MKKILATVVFTFGIFAFGTSLAGAQDLPPDDDFGDFEIQTETASGDKGFMDMTIREALSAFRQRVSFSAGTVNGAGGGVERTMSTANLGLDIGFTDNLKFLANGQYVEYENSFTNVLINPNDTIKAEINAMGDYTDQSQIRDDIPSTAQPFFYECKGSLALHRPDQSTHDDRVEFCKNAVSQAGGTHILHYYRRDVLAPELGVTLQGDDTSLNEAYLQWDAGSYVTIRLGRQKLPWGQFELYSPASVALPYASSGTSVRSSKSDLIVPQDVISVSIFPLDNLEITLLQSQGLRLDPQTAQANTQLAFEEHEATAGVHYQTGLKLNPKVQDTSDLDFQSARILYFTQQFTFGMTFTEGYNTNLSPPYRERIAKSIGFVNDPRFVDHPDGGVINTATKERLDTHPQIDDYYITEDRGLFYVPMTAISAELSVPITSSLTARAEFTTMEAVAEIELPLDRRGTGVQELFDAIVSSERGADAGRMVKRQSVIMSSIGGDYRGEKWNASLQIINFQQSDIDTKLAQLERNAERLPTDDADYEAIPFMSVARKLGANEQGAIGAGLGAFFNSLGAGIFASWTFFESVELAGFIGDTQAQGQPEDDQDYEPKGAGGAIMQLGMNFRF